MPPMSPMSPMSPMGMGMGMSPMGMGMGPMYRDPYMANQMMAQEIAYEQGVNQGATNALCCCCCL